MGFNRKKGISTVAAILILAIFNLFVFLSPIPRTATFWIGYLFVVLADVILLATILFLCGADSKERTFMRLSIVKLGWGYFVIQVGLGISEITSSLLPYLPALIINSVVTSLFIIIIFASQAASETIQKNEKYIAKKVLFIKNIQTILLGIKAGDTVVSEKLKRLVEDVKFSDPMSHSMLEDIETEIEKRAITLKSNIKDKEKALTEIEAISDLLKERNQKCKLYKNIKDEKPEKDNSGIKYVSFTVAILSVVAMVFVIIVNVIIPNNIYKSAMTLYDNQEYDKAKILFEELNGYSNSNVNNLRLNEPPVRCE